MIETTNYRGILRVFLAVTIIAFLFIAIFVPATQQETLLLAASVVSLAVISAPIFLRREYNIFEPITFIAFMILIGVTAKMLFIVVFHVESLIIYRKLLLGSSLDLLWLGCIAVLAGLSSLVFGYLLPLSSNTFIPQRLVLGQWNMNRMMRIVWLMLALSIGSFFLFIILANISITSFADLSGKRFANLEGGSAARAENVVYYLYRISLFGKYAFYFLLISFFRNEFQLRSIKGVLLILSVISTIFIPYFFNNRAGVVVIGVDAMMLYYFIRGRLNLPLVATSVGVVLILLLSISGLRHNLSGEETTINDRIEDFMGERHLLDVSKTAQIINAVPSRIEFMYGESMIGWLFAPIPRSIWPDKPISTEIGRLVSDKVYGQPFNGVPPGLIAELFMNFGWYGIIAGMAIYGMVLRLSYNLLKSGQTSSNICLIYVIVTTRFSIFAINNSLGVAILKVSAELLPFVFLIWYVSSQQTFSKAYRKAKIYFRPINAYSNANTLM